MILAWQDVAFALLDIASLATFWIEIRNPDTRMPLVPCILSVTVLSLTTLILLTMRFFFSALMSATGVALWLHATRSRSFRPTSSRSSRARAPRERVAARAWPVPARSALAQRGQACRGVQRAQQAATLTLQMPRNALRYACPASAYASRSRRRRPSWKPRAICHRMQRPRSASSPSPRASAHRHRAMPRGRSREASSTRRSKPSDTSSSATSPTQAKDG